MKSLRDEMEIVNAYELVGTYRGAAALCGTTAKTVRAEPAAGSNGGEGQVCPRCGERHERDGPNGRPCQMQAGAGEPPF